MVIIIAALCGAIPGTLAAVLGYLNRNKLSEIHVTVNGKLSALIAENQRLRTVVTPEQAAAIPVAEAEQQAA